MINSKKISLNYCMTPDESSPISNSSSLSDAQNLVAIIPAYNESLVIGSVVLQALNYVDRVIVINDCSTDNTSDIARLAGADVIDMSKNCGKASAMMAGFNRAKELGYENVVVLDGDGQHNPNEIPVVSAPVLSGEADLVIGSCYLEIKADIPKYRVAGQKELWRSIHWFLDMLNTIIMRSFIGRIDPIRVEFS